MKLFSLMVALIVAGLAVVGGTWAWGVNYTDSDEISISDDYAVKLQYYNGNDYVDAMNQPLFGTSLWCPGKTEIVYLRVVNNEQFPVNCTLNLNILENEFGNTMSYAYILNKDLKANDADHPDNWVEFCSESELQGECVLSANSSYRLLEKLPLVWNGGDYYLALAIHMDESASNDYADKIMNVSLTLQVDANYRPQETPPTPTPELSETPADGNSAEG